MAAFQQHYVGNSPLAVEFWGISGRYQAYIRFSGISLRYLLHIKQIFSGISLRYHIQHIKQIFGGIWRRC